MDNPYLDTVTKIRQEGIEEGCFMLTPHSIPMNNRWEVCRKYAWAIPDAEAIEIIASLDMPIVEIGAGTGYWASLLSQAGVDIVAFDIEPFDNHWCDANYYPVLMGGAEFAQDYPERALMLCWPCYGKSVAHDALMAYTGNTLIYIGEDEGGCTANGEFFEELSAHWHLQKKSHLIQWDGIHDNLYIYKRA